MRGVARAVKLQRLRPRFSRRGLAALFSIRAARPRRLLIAGQSKRGVAPAFPPLPRTPWERAGVRVILDFDGLVLQITLTLTLSHEYVGEGTRNDRAL